MVVESLPSGCFLDLELLSSSVGPVSGSPTQFAQYTPRLAINYLSPVARSRPTIYTFSSLSLTLSQQQTLTPPSPQLIIAGSLALLSIGFFTITGTRQDKSTEKTGGEAERSSFLSTTFFSSSSILGK